MIASLVDEETWIRTLQNIPLWRPTAKSLVVVAPHPDDETLGAGGLIADRRAAGIRVTAVCVTNGEASYQDSPKLAEIRIVEQQLALETLGVAPRDIVRLNLPDSDVSSYERDLVARLSQLVQPDTLVLAPWVRDWHPDHEACGRAAQQVCLSSGAELVYYLFWTWHQGSPDWLAGEAVRRFQLSNEQLASKEKALQHHRSQLYRQDGLPILPTHLLAPAKRAFETYILHA